MPRFPTFAVRIRKGAFWYYLEHNSAPGPFLKEDVSDPCQPVRFKEDNGWLVRFYYYRNRISIEVFHALSDGGGAIVFFRTLLAEYLRQTGVDIPAGNGVLDLNEPPREEEMGGRLCPLRRTSRTGPPPPADGVSEYRHKRAVLHVPCDDGLRAALEAARGVEKVRRVDHRIPLRGAHLRHFGKAEARKALPPAPRGAGHPHQSARLVPERDAAKLHYHRPPVYRPRARRLHVPRDRLASAAFL